MITRFQTSGASAGTVKWSCALRTPTTSPLRPSSTTIGNITCESPTASRSRASVNSSPVNGGMSTGAATMKSTVSAPRATTISAAERARERVRLAPLALLEQLGEDRHERAGQR